MALMGVMRPAYVGAVVGALAMVGHLDVQNSLCCDTAQCSLLRIA